MCRYQYRKKVTLDPQGEITTHASHVKTTFVICTSNRMALKGINDKFDKW